MTLDEIMAKHGVTCDWPVNVSCPPGWLPLLDRLFTALRANGWDGKVDQIKEKFGELRVYLQNDELKHIETLEYFMQLSMQKCQVCGEDGKTVKRNNWLATLCDEHAKE